MRWDELLMLYKELPPLARQRPMDRWDTMMARSHGMSADYHNLDLGYQYVRRVVKAEEQLPLELMTSRDAPMVRLFNHAYGEEDPDLEMALMIGTGREFAPTRARYKAMLLSKRFHLENSCKELRINRDVMHIFEKLFFDIRDRRRDRIWVSSYLYPDGVDGVLRKASDEHEPSFELMLQRVGDRCTLHDVLYFSGAAFEMVEGSNLRETTARLEGMMMAQAWLAVQAGHSGSPAVHNAIRLMAAQKASGQDAGSEDISPFASMGESIRDGMLGTKRPESMEATAARFGAGL